MTKFIQIVTGEYTYNSYGSQEKSHVVYALDENGNVHKYIPSINEWKLLLEINCKKND